VARPVRVFRPRAADLADLPAEIEWARANDGEVRLVFFALVRSFRQIFFSFPFIPSFSAVCDPPPAYLDVSEIFNLS
jgi:hypothetical protein